MTLQKLNAHYHQCRQLEQSRNTLHALQKSACSKKFGDFSAVIADLSADTQKIENTIMQEEPKIIAFIDSAADPLIREILRLRFLQGLIWKEVAATVGGGNTPDNIRVMCYRYIKSVR